MRKAVEKFAVKTQVAVFVFAAEAVRAVEFIGVEMVVHMIVGVRGL